MDKDKKEIYKIVNNALYFDDSSDYINALWNVMNVLDPDVSRDDLEYIEDIEEIGNQTNQSN